MTPSASRVPVSPVRNRPASSKLAAVAAGSPWYAENICGVRTRSSPGSPARDGAARLVDDVDRDAGQLAADRARHARAVVRVRQRHPDLGHAVALEDGLAGRLPERLEQRRRQRRRAAGEEPQAARRRRPARARAPGARGVDSACISFA